MITTASKGDLPSNTRRRLRIVFLCDTPFIEAWQVQTVWELGESSQIEVVGIVHYRLRRDVKEPAVWRIISKLMDALSKMAFQRIWQDINTDNNVALEAVGVPVLTEYAQQRENIDLYVDFRVRPDLGDCFARSSRLGVWRLCVTDSHRRLGNPAGFWEVLNGEPFTEVTVCAFDSHGNYSVVGRGVYTTFLWSWSENRRELFWKSRFLLIDALTSLAINGTPHPSTESPVTRIWTGRDGVAPNTIDGVWAFLKVVFRVLRSKVNGKLYRRDWVLLASVGNVSGQSLASYRRFDAPAGRFWADPFLVKHDGDTWSFFEDYDYSTGRGAISCFRLTEDGYDSFRTIMAPTYHLSYPFLFEYELTLYMVPESYQAGTVELWKCTNFPDQWELVRPILAAISAVDSTIVYYGERWWMFSNIDRSGLDDHGTELFIYHSSNPVDGDWIPHLANPVLVDSRRARMGGNFLKDATSGRLIRCAQLGGQSYGEGLLFYEVLKLTVDEYEERLVDRIDPNWSSNVVGVHTYNEIGDDIVMVDALIRSPRWKRSAVGKT